MKMQKMGLDGETKKIKLNDLNMENNDIFVYLGNLYSSKCA
jgi:hypothetical protein